MERIPAGRWGTPEDLAGAAVFLSSAASDYMQGHIHDRRRRVDGTVISDRGLRIADLSVPPAVAGGVFEAKSK